MSDSMRIRGGLVASVLLVAVMSVSFSAHSATIDFTKGFSAVAKEATPAVVFIEVEKNVPVRGMRQHGNIFDFFGKELRNDFKIRGAQYRTPRRVDRLPEPTR